ECFEYWDKRTPENTRSIVSLFQGLEDVDIKNLFEIMGKLERTSSELYKEAKK
ncbi:MAG TPA: MarR family transcriptional regulator, partial [Methanobacterium subterraneum]|nr:MarR family transcriptional regulator [Methanobacterium subterraneum]